jgi:hypothetical protein
MHVSTQLGVVFSFNYNPCDELSTKLGLILKLDSLQYLTKN